MAKPITPAQQRQWASTLQVLVLDAVATQTGLTAKQMAFHGGTSLHLSWDSPRFSEDLDMLVLDMEAGTVATCMRKIEKRIAERLLVIDPAFVLTIKDKSSERMLSYHISVAQPDVLGKAMVKLELWKVAPTYLEGYPTDFKAPATPDGVVVRVDAPLPVATLQTALADKMVAFATRPFLKWRDIFDVWWVKEQGLRKKAIDRDQLKAQFLHNLGAYRTVNDLPPAEALRLINKTSDDELVKVAEKDLQRFLPEELWKLYYPEVVKKMVQTTKEEVELLAASLESSALDGDGPGGASKPPSKPSEGKR